MKFIMNFNEISSRYALPTMIIIAILVIHPVVTHDCSPPSGSITCECTDTSIECSGTQTNTSEVQDYLIMTNFSQMETVILKITDLKFLPDFRFENTSIRNLTLGYDLQNLSYNFFSGSSSLVSLNLQNNSMQNIDDQLISSLSALKELFLDLNDLQDLTSKMFANLTNLNYLSITRNGFYGIKPDVIQNLFALETLILSYNNISSVENLSMISTSLTELKITHCLIQGSLEKDTFADIPNLRRLDMSYNRLSEVKPHSLSSLKDLRLLNLSYNAIQHLQESAFAEMNNLTQLDLRGNGISVVKLTSFASLQELKYLDLSSNNLSAILCEYTTDFGSLEEIYLQDNKIKMFTQGAFFYSPNLQVLDIKGNNLECSCPLTDTANYLIQNSTMKAEDLESISCIILSTKSSTPITSYTSSKCTPHDPCKKPDYTNTESPTDENYDYSDYDYSDETTTTSVKNETTITSPTTPLTTVSILQSTTLSTITDTTTNATSSTPITLVSNSESTVPSTMIATDTSTITAITTTSLSVTESTILSTQNVNTTDFTYPKLETTSSTESTEESTINDTTTSIRTTVPSTQALATSTTLSTTNTTSKSFTAGSRCSSLNLSVSNLKLDSEFMAYKNFSYDGNTFCLKWSITGNLTLIQKCVIKYTFVNGTKSKTIECPSIANEIKIWSYDEKIFKICLDIYAPKKRSFCNATLHKTTTSSIPHLTTPVITVSQESTETVGQTEINTYSTIESSETYNSTTLKEKLTTVNPSLVDSSSMSTSTVVTSSIGATNTTESTSNETPLGTDSITATLEPDGGSSRFFITALNVYFNKSNLAFATWTVNREVPFHACNMTLYVTTQDSDYNEGVYPCKNNSHRMRNVKETEIFKICIVSYHETSGNHEQCTLSVSPALEQKNRKDEDDSFSGSLIPLICLLILLVIIVIFIIFKNVSKKKHESSKYEVRAEEVKYRQRVTVRPQSSSESSTRFSYIAREKFDNI